MKTLTAREKLEILLILRYGNVARLAYDLPADYSHLRNLLHGCLDSDGNVRVRAEIGPVLELRIDNLFSEDLARLMGMGDPRWGVEGDAVLYQFRKIKNKNSDVCVLIEFGQDYCLYLNVASLAEYGDWSTARFAAALNIVLGHLLAELGNSYNRKVMATGAPPAMRPLLDRIARFGLRSEHHVDVRAACLLAARDVFWKLYLDLKRLGAPELNQAYALLNALAVMSSARPGAPREDDELVVFGVQEIVQTIEGQPVELVRSLLRKYGRGHPHRLVVGNNLLSMGSLLRRMDLALEGWAAMIEEDPECVDLTHRPKGLRRPPAESPDLEWLIKEIGGTRYPGT